MSKIIECVPNISEGRRKDIVDEIVNAIKKEDVEILDVELDADHNRAVITYIGEMENIKKATFVLAEKSISYIDLNKHKGEHPRMGAVDVIPFIPLSGVSMEECVLFSRDFAKEYAERFNIPVYLYEESALKPERKNLAVIRKGEFEGLSKEIGKNPDRKPDFGPERIHPTAGATAIGVRMPLIAYNVNLATNDIEIAKKIARAVRAKNGGFVYVKAMGFEIKNRNIVQVSMNLVNYELTPIYRVFELIKAEAKRYGVNVLESEIVGLLPLDAVIDTVRYYLQAESFTRNQIIDERIYKYLISKHK